MTRNACLITGSTGFVGQACDKFLRAQGRPIREAGRSAVDPNLKFVLGEPISPALFDSVDALVHCAYDFRASSPIDIERINVRGSIDLFTAAKASGVSRLVFISSVSAFEGCRSLYGQGKLVVEKEVLRLGGIVIRPGLVWDDSGRAGMHGRLKRLARLPILPVFGDGLQPFVMAYAEDVARCVAAALNLDIALENRLVIAANPRPIAFSELLKSLARSQGRSTCLIHMPASSSLGLLRALETCGIFLPFRSDSLLYLLYPSKNFDFLTQKSWGLEFRSYPI